MSELAVKENQTELAAQPESPSLMSVIASGQYDAAQIEQLMTLAERVEKNEAVKAYNLAMAKFRAMPVSAEKSGNNTHLRSQYSTYDDIAQALRQPLAECGFNWRFETPSDGQNQTVTCYMTHAMGHSESTSLTAPVMAGNKGVNQLQSLGVTVSYLKRYTLSALTGIATEDADGELPAPVELASLDQMTVLWDTLKEAGEDVYKKGLVFYQNKYAEHAELGAAMPKAQYPAALKSAQAKVK